MEDIEIHLCLDGKMIAQVVANGLVQAEELMRRQREKQREREYLLWLAYQRLDEEDTPGERR